MIQSANNYQRIQLIESDNKHLTFFVWIKRLFMGLSRNIQQLPKHFIAISTCDFIANNSLKNTLSETDFFDSL